MTKSINNYLNDIGVIIDNDEFNLGIIHGVLNESTISIKMDNIDLILKNPTIDDLYQVFTIIIPKCIIYNIYHPDINEFTYEKSELFSDRRLITFNHPFEDLITIINEGSLHIKSDLLGYEVMITNNNQTIRYYPCSITDNKLLIEVISESGESSTTNIYKR